MRWQGSGRARVCVCKCAWSSRPWWECLDGMGATRGGGGSGTGWWRRGRHCGHSVAAPLSCRSVVPPLLCPPLARLPLRCSFARRPRCRVVQHAQAHPSARLLGVSRRVVSARRNSVGRRALPRVGKQELQEKRRRRDRAAKNPSGERERAGARARACPRHVGLRTLLSRGPRRGDRSPSAAKSLVLVRKGKNKVD